MYLIVDASTISRVQARKDCKDCKDYKLILL